MLASAKWELVAQASSLIIYKNMVRTFSGALSLLLTILILRVALPEVGQLVTEIIVKMLTAVNSGLDATSQL